MLFIILINKYTYCLAFKDSYSFFIKSSNLYVSSFLLFIFIFDKKISLFFLTNSEIVSRFSFKMLFILYYYFLESWSYKSLYLKNFKYYIIDINTNNYCVKFFFLP